jgi:hypothetical protein
MGLMGYGHTAIVKKIPYNGILAINPYYWMMIIPFCTKTPPIPINSNFKLPVNQIISILLVILSGKLALCYGKPSFFMVNDRTKLVIYTI